MFTYDTVSEAVAGLQQRGYTGNLNLQQEYLACSSGVQLKPDEFHIDEVYRFEGDTDPGDEMVVYAISSASKNYKGILVNAFGIYAEDISSMLIEKLSTH